MSVAKLKIKMPVRSTANVNSFSVRGQAVKAGVTLHCIVINVTGKVEYKDILTEELCSLLQCNPKELTLTRCPHLSDTNIKGEKYNVVIYHKGTVILKPSQQMRQNRLGNENTSLQLNILASFVATSTVNGMAILASQKTLANEDLKQIVENSIKKMKQTPKKYIDILSNHETLDSIMGIINGERTAQGKKDIDMKEIHRLHSLKKGKIEKEFAQFIEKSGLKEAVNTVEEKLNLAPNTMAGIAGDGDVTKLTESVQTLLSQATKSPAIPLGAELAKDLTIPSPAIPPIDLSKTT